MNSDQIKQILSAHFIDAHIEVNSDDNTHFAAIVASDVFNNKRPLERQRMVYAIIGDYITSGSIHALTLKTFTKQEWQLQCAN